MSLQTGGWAFDGSEDFEDGFGDWSVERGVWSIGESTGENGPSAYQGSGVAGTTLTGDYPDSQDARLVSPRFIVRDATVFPRIRFYQWYSLSTNTNEDTAQLQVRVGTGEWQDFSGNPLTDKGESWSPRVVDLEEYAGEEIQIGFHFVSSSRYTALGWYIDDFELLTD